jgi:hypothetical protein
MRCRSGTTQLTPGTFEPDPEPDFVLPEPGELPVVVVPVVAVVPVVVAPVVVVPVVVCSGYAASPASSTAVALEVAAVGLRTPFVNDQ